MKKFAPLAVVVLLFASVALSSQETSTTSPKPKKTPMAKPVVDCTKVDDATLTTNVKDKLAKTPSLKDATINVAVKDGVVTLTGSVKKPTNKGLATLQTKRVACIKKVDNQLTIESASAAPQKAKT
ncbi:MAG: BON domain-containing protein [Acidobacteria bacterium]|nr:BON domain-containing protein [Acidobacteriota bacterium]